MPSITPRTTVVVSMLWLGLLVVTAKTQFWQNVRDYITGKTH